MFKLGGRLSLIFYYFFEDRLVKCYMCSGFFEGELEKDVFGRVDVFFKLVGKFIIFLEEEISKNNRVWSVKLRIVEKLKWKRIFIIL